MKPSPAFEAVPHWITVERGDPEGSELERQWDECFEGMLSRRDAEPSSSKLVRQNRYDAMARGLKTAQWMSNGALAAAVKVGANRRMRLRCEQEDLMNELHCERQAAEELQTELSSEMRELRDRCHEQGQTVGLLTQRLADARSAIAAELQDAAAERAALGAELSEESQRNRLQAAMVHEEAEATSRVEAYEQQLASMVAVRDSLQAQLEAALKVQTELREHLAAERDGRAELEVAGEREMLAWEKNKEMMHSPGAELQSVRDAQTKLQQHLNAEAVLCEREAAALRDRMEELEEEMQAAEESKQRCTVALGAAGCEWTLLHEEAAEAEQAASVRSAELERITRQAREIQAQVHGVKEDILQCRQDHTALELKQERDFLHEEVQQEALRQEDLYLELDEARRSRSLFQCLFPRKPPPQPPLPPPSTATMRTKPQPIRTSPTFQGSNSGGMSSAPRTQHTAQRSPQRQGAGESSSEEEDSESEDLQPQAKRHPAGGRPPQADTDFIESDEV